MRLTFILFICGIYFIFATKLFSAEIDGNITLNNEINSCLVCHSKKDQYFTLENGEKINTFIDIAQFRQSAHSKLKCSSCHAEFSEKNHPKRRYRDLDQYRKQLNLICKRCHHNDIEKIPVHNSVISKAGESEFICTLCHSAHNIESFSNGQSTEASYCLTCHSKKNKYTNLKNGAKLFLYFDKNSFEKSVHSALNCSDCHFGFSRNNHPKRSFDNYRDFRIVLSETCRRCHFDKYTRTLESIHNKILSEGRLDAPVCTDCHGSHNIKHFGKHRIEIAQRCQLCHKKIYNTYINSVHGKALIDIESTDVPICIDCHTAHDIQNPMSGDYRNKIPEMCSNCHNNKKIMNKYGLSTKVTKTYIDDFHGKAFILNKNKLTKSTAYTKKIAVCTDCHGIHDIKSMRTIDRETIKTNLLTRCRKCHSEASQNFSDAWLSHYIPSIHHYSLLYIIIIMYKFFIPLLITTLILQILLHIWRYAINR
jgi:predicted transcriptional regulator